MSQNLILFGNERLATGCSTQLPILRSLLTAGFKIKFIVLSQKPKSKSRSKDRLEVVDFATKAGIEIFTPNNDTELKNKIIQSGVELAVLVAYGRIISEEILNLFRFGIVNLHPSLLPKYRGPTPIESVILNGDTQTGVSIMSLVRKMDAGPLWTQRELKLSGVESKQELADRLGELGADTLVGVLGKIFAGSQPIDQAGQPTFCRLIEKSQGLLDCVELDAKQAEKAVRAYAGWPKAKIKLSLANSSDEIFVELTAVDAPTTSLLEFEQHSGSEQLKLKPAEAVFLNDQLLVGFKNKTYLKILKLKPEGKVAMSAKDFMNGLNS